MKIQCQSCQAKYTIADEKVLGKVVKIRCKKCSATIVINGNETRGEDNSDTNVFDYAAQGNEPWTVNVADGDQRTMNVQEILAEYRAGVVTDETYCWKDGMADWLPLREIDQLYGQLGMDPRPSLHDDMVAAAPHSVPPAGAPLFGTEPAHAESPYAAHGNGNGNGNGHGALFGDGQVAAAARRTAGRGQGQDLFSGAAQAGGEEDVLTSAAGPSASHGGGGGGGGGGLGGAMAEEPKLTGQRNENSVLFSLSALTKDEAGASPSPSPNRTTATADGSGLIDIRALSANMGSDAEPRKDAGSRVDDIMNLSGGGAFGAALAAPILAPPPLETSEAVAASGGKSNKGLLLAIVGGGALIAAGIIVAVVLTRTPPPSPSTANPSTTNTTASANPVVAANDPGSNPNAAVTTPTTDNTPPPPSTGQAASPAGKPGAPVVAGKPGAAAPAAAKDPKAADPTPTPPPAAAPKENPKDLAGALAAAAGKPAEAPKDNGAGGSAAPFDRGAAQAAIGAVNPQACKKPDGPVGSGHVTITFAPNGSVASAVVDSGPFPGTPVGGCIAGKYRSPHIPAFSGGPVRVGKSFTIN